MRHWLMRLSRDDSAATAVEYAVLLALILVVVIVAIDSLGSTSSGMWATDTSRITSADRWALVPQHGNGVSRSREFAYTSQTLDCEARR